MASRTVVVSVLVLDPSAATVLGEATKVVVMALAGPAIKVTGVVACTDPAVAVTVLGSAVLDTMVEVNCPELSVAPAGGVNVLLDPEELKLTA